MLSPHAENSDGAELAARWFPSPLAALVLCPVPLPSSCSATAPTTAMIYQIAYERSLELSRASAFWSSLNPSTN